MRVLISGNYGSRTERVDGQAIKTRTLRDALIEQFGADGVATLDTSTIFRSPVRFYLEARRQFAGCTHVIMLPGRRGLRVLLPLFLYWRRSYPKDLRYVVIGGWLPQLLSRSRTLRSWCRRLEGIYVETPSMADQLGALGLSNVHILPNFRSFDREMPRRAVAASRPIKLVFCARVIPEKGIEEAIAAVDGVNAGSDEPVATLDIYGPVPGSYTHRLDRLVNAARGAAYHGVLEGEQLHDVLQRYDLVVFPTYYPGEGFPGTIIDAFIAGVPVLATDWKYNREIVEVGVTGAICRPRSAGALMDALRRYIAAPQLLTAMRPHCIRRAHAYHVEHALSQLLQHLAAITPGSPFSRRRQVPAGHDRTHAEHV